MAVDLITIATRAQCHRMQFQLSRLIKSKKLIISLELLQIPIYRAAKCLLFKTKFFGFLAEIFGSANFEFRQGGRARLMMSFGGDEDEQGSV